MSAFWRRVQQVARRATTVVLLVLLVAAPLESMFPDAHDRDVAGAQSIGDSQSHGDAPAHNGGRTDSHPVHLDHCSHSHPAGIPERQTPESNGLFDALRIAIDPPGLHESIVLPPQQRPPIA